MKRLLTTTAIVAGALYFGAPTAQADVIIDGILYLDPAAFHVTATGATGSDPVLLNNNHAFSIQDVGGLNIDKPLTIFIAGPVGSAVPTISAVNYDNGAITPVTGPFPTTLVGDKSIIGTDLYTAIGCVACDNSLNQANIQAAYVADGLASPSTLRIWSFTINQAFVGKDQIDVTGNFANGDIVFPLASNIEPNKVTFFDTSWTNTGFVDCPPGPSCTVTPPPPPPPPPPPVPEPASLLLLGVGLLGTAAFARKRRV